MLIMEVDRRDEVVYMYVYTFVKGVYIGDHCILLRQYPISFSQHKIQIGLEEHNCIHNISS